MRDYIMDTIMPPGPQRLPMLTFATKKLSTGPGRAQMDKLERRMQPLRLPSLVRQCRSFDRAVMLLRTPWHFRRCPSILGWRVRPATQTF